MDILKYYPHYWIGLVLVLAAGVIIRIQNLGLMQGKYILELDPYYFLRMARAILATGSAPVVDMMRYYPLGHETASENIFLSYVFVYLYKFLALFFPGITLEQAVIFYPVIFFVIGLICFFFLARSLFNIHVAFFSTLFLAVIPAYLQRTMAGFADKEAMGLTFMYLTFLLFIKGHMTHSWTKAILLGLTAGAATGLMGLSWGGFKFALIIIAIFYFMLFILEKLEDRHIILYGSWALISTVFLSFFTAKYGGIIGLLTSSTTAFMYGVLVIIVAHRMVAGYYPKLNLPKPMISIVAIGILAGIAGIFFSAVGVFSFAQDIHNLLTAGLSNNRLGLTVAENRLPYFGTWIETFGIFYFCIFVIGIFLLFKNTLPLTKHKGLILTAFAIMLFGFIFSRAAQGSFLDGESIPSLFLYTFSFALLTLSAMFIYLRGYWRDKQAYHELTSYPPLALFFLIWFLVTVLAARGGVRLFIILAPTSAIAAGYLAWNSLEYGINHKERLTKYAVFFLVALVSIPIVFSNAATSFRITQYTGPSFNAQWQEAMEWVQEKTPSNAVFAHWWDYGYWVQTGGNRATITDGGNFIPYWNHLVGRHVLSARNETEALEFLYAHGATNLLIISDEIGKYTAYSSIGSDENFDIFSWIGTFVMNPQQIVKEGNITTYFFAGFTALDDDVFYNDRIFPRNDAYIGALKIPVVEDEDSGTYRLEQPSAVVFYHEVREEVPIQCIYDKKKIYFNASGLRGCVRIFPRIIDATHQQENGAIMYVSEKGLSALWAKLFLFNEDTEHFSLVYDDSARYRLAYYNGQVPGPLKIWRISYPGNFTISDSLREEYLARTTPEWLRLEGITL